jgi:hypothetical protein
MGSTPVPASRRSAAEKRANRSIWIVTLLTTAVILAIAISFFLFSKAQRMRRPMVSDSPSLATSSKNPLGPTFLQAEMDLALGFLHLAQYAIVADREGHASELIARAAVRYKTILDYISSVPLELDDTTGLHASACKLFEAIRAAERHRNHKLGALIWS